MGQISNILVFPGDLSIINESCAEMLSQLLRRSEKDRETETESDGDRKRQRDGQRHREGETEKEREVMTGLERCHLRKFNLLLQALKMEEVDLG